MLNPGALLLLSLSLPPASAAGGPPPKDYEALVKDGRQRLKEGDDAQAQAAFAKALAFPSHDYRAEAGLARVNEDLGRWEKAAEHYERALDESPDKYALCMKLAQTYVQLGRLDLAKRTFARAKSIDPKEADAYIKEGYAYLEVGDHAQAQAQFQSVISLDTSSAYGYHHMASYFSNLGEWTAAERYIRKALELIEKSPPGPRRLYDVLHATQKLAAILEMEGRLTEAESVLRRALPESVTEPYWHVEFLDTLGVISSKQGRREEAEAFFRQAAALCEPEALCAKLPLKQRASPILHLAALDIDEGREAQAETEADKACRRFPAADKIVNGDLYTLFLGGDIYFRIGNDAKAEKIFRLAFSQREKMPPIVPLGQVEARLASLCSKSGRYEEAAALYRDAIRIARLSGRPLKIARLEVQLSWTLIRAGMSRLGAH